MKVLTFGEIMLRLKAPGHERFFQSPMLEATFGGGEANVAVSLANYGLDAKFVTALPDNDVGTACLREIHARVAALIARHAPDVLSIESVIYGKNAGTMLVLGEARGAVITAAAAAGVPVYEYEPRRVKMAVCGNGLAEKLQVQRMVKTLLALDELPQNDAADALALAIAHAHANTLLGGREPV